MEFVDYLKNTVPITTIELLAAIAGTYYIKKNASSKSSKYFVYFLWFIFLIEVIGAYSPIAYFSKYKYFSFVENTPYRNNYWLYNCTFIVGFSFYAYYFRSFLKNNAWRLILKSLIYLYILSAIIYLIVSDVFYTSISQYSSISGTILLIISISFFYFELLKSDMLLNLKKFLPFYISIGALVFYICVTPIDIFSEYFKTSTGNDMFVQLRVNIMLFANIFMYSIFILGFLICSRKKRSY